MTNGNQGGIGRFRIIRDPWESEELLFAIDPAIDCDGGDCGSAFPDGEGGWEDLPPHFHLKVSGRRPEGGPELCAVDGELPKVMD